MPQPIKLKAFSANYQSRRILGRPDLAAKIAWIANEWSGVEEFLGALMSVLLSRDRHGYAHQGHAILNALISLPAKLDAINAAARFSLKDNDLSELEKNLLPTIRTRAKERNKVVHAKWGVSNSYPNDLIAIPNWDSAADPVRYESKDFDDIAQRISETKDALKQFIERLSQRSS